MGRGGNTNTCAATATATVGVRSRRRGSARTRPRAPRSANVTALVDALCAGVGADRNLAARLAAQPPAVADAVRRSLTDRIGGRRGAGQLLADRLGLADRLRDELDEDAAADAFHAAFTSDPRYMSAADFSVRRDQARDDARRLAARAANQVAADLAQIVAAELMADGDRLDVGRVLAARDVADADTVRRLACAQAEQVLPRWLDGYGLSDSFEWALRDLVDWPSIDAHCPPESARALFATVARLEGDRVPAAARLVAADAAGGDYDAAVRPLLQALAADEQPVDESSFDALADRSAHHGVPCRVGQAPNIGEAQLIAVHGARALGLGYAPVRQALRTWATRCLQAG